MEALQSYHDTVLRQLKARHVRDVYYRIPWQQRMIAIKGPRGAGKTTLMLQHLKHQHGRNHEKALYLTADFHWFYTHSLFNTVDQFYKNGGRFLYIDEVHKYPNWSRELKNIYDGFPDLKVVFSSSSALEVHKGESDLSRRVLTYEIPGLSFREYLLFTGHEGLNILELNDILFRHADFVPEITSKFHPLPAFKKYLKFGYLPFFKEVKEETIPLMLAQVINTVLDSDLAFIEGYTPSTTYKVKKLLGVIAESAPFKPNIAALSRKLDVSRDSIYSWMDHLEKARLINLLHQAGKGLSLLQKPDKLYLENTNLAYALNPSPDVGSLRETFILNQLRNSSHKTGLPKSGDFLVDETILLEVGGKNKSSQQIRNIDDAFLVKDDIELGFGHTIPLWLFGFLY